jgi:small-conductance mechanosensitive channel
MVEHHGPLLEQRAHVALRVLAVSAWVVATLDFLGLLAPVLAGGRAILTAELTQGALRISIGDVLAFAITIYAAFLFSSLVRFVLEEDVFPRLHLSAGLPYALTSVFRYCVIFVGFILALLALGVNLDRVTVLGGAFGIGIGFGLQNIVNNFVSGLIVLFERPIRVGDAVQIGDVQGEVRRIGIRSSTVRNWEGAEVIVPNSQLVADKVTNWTPAQPRRRIDIAVGVAYGTAPDKVLKVLGEVAGAHPDVAADPAPQALFLGFGDSALKFELRVWTRRLDRHVAVKSELGIAVYAALREAGMTIPFPQQEIRVVSGPETAPSKPQE